MADQPRRQDQPAREPPRSPSPPDDIENADIPDREALEIDRSIPIDDVGGEPAGVEDVKELETTVGAAASGVLLEADQEQAQQRVHDVQVILAELGYLTGQRGDPGEGVDGIWGPATRDALAEFQAEHELEANGQIDAETYEALLAEHETALGASSDDEGVEEDPFSPVRPEKPLAD